MRQTVIENPLLNSAKTLWTPAVKNPGQCIESTNPWDAENTIRTSFRKGGES